jgi:hypothetical protein
MATTTTITKNQKNSPVMIRDAKPEDVVNYTGISYKTVFGIDDTIRILNVCKVKPDTTAGDLRMIDFELGDQVAKKARIFAMMHAFMANQRAMRPPTEEMIASAKKLATVLEEMIAANVTANQVVVTATQLFKIWHNTEA